MRMPRLTIRALMVAVAATALGLARRDLSARAREYRSRANHHEFIEKGGRALLRTGEQRTPVGCGDIPDKVRKHSSDELAQLSKVVDHHRGLRMKYSRAARYPWLPVAPDPPVPK